MVTPPIAALWFLPFVVPVAFLVALSDLKRMKIPNWSFFAMLGIFLVVGPFVLPLEDWAWRWLHLVVVLAVTFLLYVLNQLGAGDSKFIAAMAPFVAMQDAGKFMVILAFGALAALILKWLIGLIPAVRRAVGHWESYSRRRVFPYGLGLSLAIVLYLVLCVLY